MKSLSTDQRTLREIVEAYSHRQVTLRRRLTGWYRVLPDFVIVGAQKCGTSSLYAYVLQHPCVLPALRKEIHFFGTSKYYTAGINWYRAHFATSWQKQWLGRRYGHTLLTGEASPSYMFRPHAPRQLRVTIPRAKLIVLLRNPVDRAYSHYQHMVRAGVETLSFEEAIEREPERIKGEMERMIADARYTSSVVTRHGYLAKGLYVDQMKRLCASFPREQILVVRSEDLQSSPNATVDTVSAFLDLPPHPLSTYRHFQVGTYPAMSTVMRNRLLDYFAPHNKQLCEYLGINMGWDEEAHNA